MAYVEAVCTSHKKGIVKREQKKVVLKENFGMETDAHAGDWHRQISLLAGESIDTVKETLPTLKNGAFAENIITRGIDLTQLSVGDRSVTTVAVPLRKLPEIASCPKKACLQ
jgi:MOSC domain-containing protein YiiM